MKIEIKKIPCYSTGAWAGWPWAYGMAWDTRLGWPGRHCMGKQFCAGLLNYSAWAWLLHFDTRAGWDTLRGYRLYKMA